MTAAARPGQRAVLVGFARAFGGALFFALPLFMTMEMWALGFAMDRMRMLVLVAVFLPVLVGLTHYAGFESTTGWREDVRDALVAIAVGFVTSAAVLTLVGLVDASSRPREAIGMIVLEAIPASIGAALAESILGGQADSDEERRRGRIGYWGELFLMGAGAIFFAFNVAPTEEMLMLAVRMSPWHMLAAIVVSMVLMHAFVYSVEFHGQEPVPEGTPRWRLFLFFTVVGYALALLISAFVLWVFGRYEGMGLGFRVGTAVVLAFPAALGAAAARLVL
ncbi:MAG TPA: TIGR02587 family membrane protein [Gemmatimonadaceae bacterium]|nr:TIGR02587 family membrane protein [Gemmatimonadaceae bacterium]